LTLVPVTIPVEEAAALSAPTTCHAAASNSYYWYYTGQYCYCILILVPVTIPVEEAAALSAPTTCRAPASNSSELYASVLAADHRSFATWGSKTGFGGHHFIKNSRVVCFYLCSRLKEFHHQRVKEGIREHQLK
jgi:hypothetical protein